MNPKAQAVLRRWGGARAVTQGPRTMIIPIAAPTQFVRVGDALVLKSGTATTPQQAQLPVATMLDLDFDVSCLTGRSGFSDED